jgi:hypothetical protein
LVSATLFGSSWRLARSPARSRSSRSGGGPLNETFEQARTRWDEVADKESPGTLGRASEQELSRSAYALHVLSLLRAQLPSLEHDEPAVVVGPASMVSNFIAVPPETRSTTWRSSCVPPGEPAVKPKPSYAPRLQRRTPGSTLHGVRGARVVHVRPAVRPRRPDHLGRGRHGGGLGVARRMPPATVPLVPVRRRRPRRGRASRRWREHFARLTTEQVRSEVAARDLGRRPPPLRGPAPRPRGRRRPSRRAGWRAGRLRGRRRSKKSTLQWAASPSPPRAIAATTSRGTGCSGTPPT